MKAQFGTAAAYFAPHQEEFCSITSVLVLFFTQGQILLADDLISHNLKVKMVLVLLGLIVTSAAPRSSFSFGKFRALGSVILFVQL